MPQILNLAISAPLPRMRVSLTNSKELQMSSNDFDFYPPRLSVVSWSFAATACIGFGLLPWITNLQRIVEAPFKPVMLILVAWSLLPVSLGVYLLYMAFRRIRLIIVAPNVIAWESTLFGWQTSKKIKFDRVYFAKHRRHRRRTIDEQWGRVFKN